MLKESVYEENSWRFIKNRNIEESLKKYTGGFMKINNKYALIRLAMNYYILCVCFRRMVAW